MRHNPRKGPAGQPSRPSPSDPNLLNRLEEYAHGHNLSDIDGALEYLRRNYPEYRRKQTGPFRKYITNIVHLVRRRFPGPVDGEEGRGPRRAIPNNAEERLREKEDAHLVRRMGRGEGDMNEDLAFEGSDNSSENSDGVESDDTSQSDAERDGADGGGEMANGDGNGRRSPGSIGNRGLLRAEDGGRGKAKVGERARGFTGSAQRRHADREGRERDGSDSEEEELAFAEMEAAIPAFNLMNSSLRSTYNGRPVLVCEPSAAGPSSPPFEAPETIVKNGGAVTFSSSSFRVSPVRGKMLLEERDKHQGECSLAAPGSITKVGEEERERTAFAPPSVIAEAVRAAAAITAKKKVPKVDQEKREAFGRASVHGDHTERALLSRSSPPAQSSGRLPPALKSWGQFQGPSGISLENGGKLHLQNYVNGTIEKSKHQEEAKRESRGASQESKLLNKRLRDSERTRASNKRGKWVAQKGEKDGLEGGVGGKGTTSSSTVPQKVSFMDLGGIEGTLQLIRELIERPLTSPELYEWLGVQPPRGVLLHGPSGCGKTMLANAIAMETGVPFLKISAPEVVSGMSGESEAKVRSLFAEAVKVAPCIIFIDEIDAITPKRETAQREMERRIVAQLLTCMDDLSQPRATADKGESSGTIYKRPGHVVVIGATNRPDALDPALRRAGRFDREIALGIPDEDARGRILAVLARKLRLEGSFDFKQIARRTPGFVGVDLAALTNEAGLLAINRIWTKKDVRSQASSSVDAQMGTVPGGEGDSVGKGGDSQSEDWRSGMDGADVSGDDPSTLGLMKGSLAVHKVFMESACVGGEIESERRTDQGLQRLPWSQGEMESLSITMQDFEEAIDKVQPSAKREGFATIPDVTWDDVGSLGSVREELEFSISRPIKHPEEYRALGLDLATGVLLYGPPGCGKTLVAKAIANDAGANFISIKGPELLNKYVGESERAVRQLFMRARASAPCVLFFDEMDAMAPRRGSDGNAAAERVVNQLLTEMDGLEQRKSIFLIAATNRPDMLDPALLRPGRLDKLLYVPLPDPAGRASILRTLVRRVPIAEDVDVGSIGDSMRCEGFSGADLAALVREACIAALRDRIAEAALADKALPPPAVPVNPPLITARHFEAAFMQVFPSVSSKDQMRYEELRQKLRRARGHLKSTESDAEGLSQRTPAV